MKVSVSSRFSLLAQNVDLLVIYSCPLYLMAFLLLYIQSTEQKINWKKKRKRVAMA